MRNYLVETPGAKFYRGLPYYYAAICIFELISSFVVLYTLTQVWKASSEDTQTTGATRITSAITITTITTTTPTTTTSLPPEVIIRHLIAVGIGLTGTILPIFTGFILFLSMFTCCSCIRNENSRRPFLRFVALNCNCPCYIPRPKLRFTIRLGLHIICITLRIIAVIIYAIEYIDPKTASVRNAIQALLILTAACLIFPFLTILLDIYHYRVWWAYKPHIDISTNIARKSFSHKHKRFIPYVLTEPFRTAMIGNRKCKYGNRCQSRELEHVVIFHSSNYQPQPRWSKHYPVYIGFHRTSPQAAYEIATSEFRPSTKGMLGPGAYFARSTEATSGKIGNADQTGAWFVAEIFMGKVLPVNDHEFRRHASKPGFEPELQPYIKSGQWSTEYDTCYLNHEEENKDEFCIKDPAKQILRWVVVIENPYDHKLLSYGLLTEVGPARCGCC